MIEVLSQDLMYEGKVKINAFNKFVGIANIRSNNA